MKKTSGRYVTFHAVHEQIFRAMVGVMAACYAGTPSATAAVSEQGTFDLNAALHRIFATKRSEEHTSELQSLAYLVCRLLLEKKKKIQTTQNTRNITNID